MIVTFWDAGSNDRTATGTEPACTDTNRTSFGTTEFLLRYFFKYRTTDTAQGFFCALQHLHYIHTYIYIYIYIPTQNVIPVKNSHRITPEDARIHHENDKHRTFNVRGRGVRVTTGHATMELQVTVNNIQILSVAQECFYSEFWSPVPTKRILTFMYSARCVCLNLTKPEVSRRISMQVPNVKFHGNSSSGSRADTCERA